VVWCFYCCRGQWGYAHDWRRPTNGRCGFFEDFPSFHPAPEKRAARAPRLDATHARGNGSSPPRFFSSTSLQVAGCLRSKQQLDFFFHRNAWLSPRQLADHRITHTSKLLFLPRDPPPPPHASAGLSPFFSCRRLALDAGGVFFLAFPPTPHPPPPTPPNLSPRRFFFFYALLTCAWSGLRSRQAASFFPFLLASSLSSFPRRRIFLLVQRPFLVQLALWMGAWPWIVACQHAHLIKFLVFLDPNSPFFRFPMKLGRFF